MTKTVRFFRGRLRDLFHCDPDCTVAPECVQRLIPREATAAALSIDDDPADTYLECWEPAPHLSTIKSIVRPVQLTARDREQLHAHYRELLIDTELEVT